jgi:hypothetical protein
MTAIAKLPQSLGNPDVLDITRLIEGALSRLIPSSDW